MRDRDEADRKFEAALHGRTLQERDGRVHGMRQGVMAEMRARQRRSH